jgi:glutaredoxin
MRSTRSGSVVSARFAVSARSAVSAPFAVSTSLAVALLPVLLPALALLLAACSGGERAATSADPAQAGEIVDPPFAVRGDLDGLVLTWFDAEGPHTAEHLDDVPVAARAEVRVDSLSLSPEQRDPESVFVADLRSPGPDGRYVVRRMSRASFEARARAARPSTDEAVATSGEVIVFGASWCGACRQAEAYLRERGVPFVEHDIEEDPAARQDMIRRARAAGIQPDGIPIIDVRGRVLQGFDPGAIDRALRETGGVPPTVGPATGTGQGVTI